ncbi:MAG: glycoside hydrolase family 57 protein [Dehalococcoidia bacterium]
MANNLAVYTVVHQPRRLKLPAQPIPKGATPKDIERCLFDEKLNERYFHKVGTYCYYPATEMFLELVKQGFKLSIGFSESFLMQARSWDKKLLALFQELVEQQNVELIGVEPYHSFLPLIDLPLFQKRMDWGRRNLEKVFGKRPSVTDTTEMLMSDGIYHALCAAGFTGALFDGREWVLGWRDATHLYHQGKDMMLLARHYQLSDDVGYRFSNRGWWGYPLMADAYTHWLKEARGDFVFLAWDYETFGEHHSKDTGIFDFMRHLPEELDKRRVTLLTPSEVIANFRELSFHLPLTAYPCTWAGEGGMEFFLGNNVQQAVFQLMLHAYNKALLTKNREIIDLALWLTQSDNLHLIQWFGRWGADAEVSAYFTPDEWWELGPSGIVWQMQQVYKNFIEALDAYL